MNKSLIIWLLATWLPAAIAERDPFNKVLSLRTPEVKTVSVGVIGDGHCWHIWHATSDMEWRESLPLSSPRPLSEKWLFIHKAKEEPLAMSAAMGLPRRYPFECSPPSVLDEVRD